MAYQFLDANGSILTAASSIQSGVNFPQVFVVGSVQTVANFVQSGTVISSISGTVVVQSIVGTYSEDAQHSSTEKGLFVLGVRNDTLSSITSTDNDYSPVATGPSGEVIAANAPITRWVQGTASIMTSAGGSVLVLAAGGSSVFTYVTGLQFAGFGSQSVLLTIGGGLGSVLGKYVVPAGGSQITGFIPNAIKTGENSAVTASIGGSAAVTSSVFVGIQGFTAKI